jgi:hypothetical protein
VKLKFKKRRLIPVALAILVLVVGSGVAYAFWTAGGSGSGNANAAAGTTPVTAYQTGPALLPMYPGDSPQTISGDFTNTNSGPVYVTSVTASIASVSKAGVPAVGCDATDFTLNNLGSTGPTAAVGAQIPVGSATIHTGAWTGITIQFNNKSGLTGNQDACKGVTVNLSYSVL